MKKVVILQHRLLHYRVGFFDTLREKCKSVGIDLYLVHGQATRREEKKNDVGSLDWAITVRNAVWEVGGRDVIWQPLPAAVKDADLVVLMQESRILSNYPILLSRVWRSRKVAYWGHGKNFQADQPEGAREAWKRLLLKSVDWWFAYTDMTREILEEQGYPASRITCLNNAIDNAAFQDDLASISESDVLNERSRLSIEPNDAVLLFCGSLYPDKKLDYLVEGVGVARSLGANISVVVIGDGPSRTYLESVAGNCSWLKLVGVKKGREKALYFRMARLMLNPGLVGLHIVDSFCAGLPMLTTRGARHSPEVVYMVSGENGLMLNDSVQEYGEAIVSLLADERRLEKMREAALIASSKYTLENMARNFLEGIQGALKS